VSDRRVIKFGDAGGGEARSLELTEEAFTPTAGEVVVRTSSSLLDPLTLADSDDEDSLEVSFSGVISALDGVASDELAVGDTVFGVGPPADFVSLPAAELERAPGGAPLEPHQAAAIPYLCSFWEALNTIAPDSSARILISGQPVVRHLAAQLVRSLLPEMSLTEADFGSIAELPSELDQPFDILIHGVGDPDDLQLSLSAVDLDGRAFLLVPPGEHVLSHDFYPSLHRSCLRSLVRRVGRPCRPASCPDPGHRALYERLAQGEIDVEPVISHAASTADLADLALGREPAAGKLVSLAWP